MVLSADAAPELAEMAAVGRLRASYAAPRLYLQLPARVERGGRITVAWRTVYARDVRIVVVSEGFEPLEIAVPVKGCRLLPDLPVGRHVIRLRARPRTHRPSVNMTAVVEEVAVVEVFAPAPVLKIAAPPPRIVLGTPATVSWRAANATRVRLLADGAERVADPTGTATFHPAGCGSFAIVLEAVGDGGMATKRLSVMVVAPPVVFQVPNRITANLADDIAIAYRISGAATVTLQRLDSDDPIRSVPSAGRIVIGAIIESERLRFVATGYDGKASAKTVLIDVASLFVETIDDLLKGLNGGP